MLHLLGHTFLFSLFFAPLVLFPDLFLLLRGEVILDVEDLPDLLRAFPLHHVGHRFATQFQKTLDIQVVGGQDDLKEGGLVDLEEVRVPCWNVLTPSLQVLVLVCRLGVILVIGRPLDDLLQDLGVNVGQWYNFFLGGIILHAQVLEHRPDRV